MRRATAEEGGGEEGGENGMFTDQNVEKKRDNRVAEDAVDEDVGRVAKSGEGKNIFNL